MQHVTRWRRLSIAGLWTLIVIRLCASAVASSEDEAHEDAVAAIQSLGGSVRSVSRNSPDVRVDFHLRGRKLTNKGLANVARLKNVVALNLRGTRITSQGLGHLEGLTRLRVLHLERTEIGDAGAPSLSRLRNLEYLNLYGTKITDKTLEQLPSLNKLRRLYVWQTDVTDAGVKRLELKLSKLKVVRGVDLSRLPTYRELSTEEPDPKIVLKWIAVSNVANAPRSGGGGLNTQVLFKNESGHPVKLYWVDFGGQLKEYATLAPGESRRQNSYSRHTWLITDDDGKPLGYFVVAEEPSRAIIPKAAG